MRRLTCTGLIALAILVGFARPASAQWSLLKWLEELSGPGDFVMNGVDVALYCGPKTVSAKNTEVYGYLFCDRDPATWTDVKWAVGAQLLWGRGTNPLTYPSTVTKKEHVSAQSYAASLTYRVSRVTDVAADIGFVRFSGAEGIAFNKFVFDPYIAVRPLATFTDGRWERSFEIRFGALMFPQGFTLADFGADGGAPLAGDAELITHLGFYVTVPLSKRK